MDEQTKKNKFSPSRLAILGIIILVGLLISIFTPVGYSSLLRVIPWQMRPFFAVSTAILGAALIILGFAISLRFSKIAKESVEKRTNYKIRIVKGLIWIIVGLLIITVGIITILLAAPEFSVEMIIVSLLYSVAAVYLIINGIKTIKDDAYISGFVWVVLGLVILGYVYPPLYLSLLGRIVTSPAPGAPKVSPVSILARYSPLLILATYLIIRGVRIMRKKKIYDSSSRR